MVDKDSRRKHDEINIDYGKGEMVGNSNIFDHEADYISFDEDAELKFTAPAKKVEEKKEAEEEPQSSPEQVKGNFPWMSQKTLQTRNMHLKLHNEILDFHDFVKANSEDVLKKKLVVRKLRGVIKELFPDAKVLVFGSCATDLNLPNSDVDLLVYNPQKSEQKMIKDITSELVSLRIPSHIEPITTSKVPIIKLEDKESKVHVDISFNRTNGIYCVKLVLKLL